MESYPKVKTAAEKALRIDNAAAEAHLSMAFVKWYFEWDWDGAEREYQRTLELNPNLAEAWAWYGRLLTFLGKDKPGGSTQAGSKPDYPQFRYPPHGILLLTEPS